MLINCLSKFQNSVNENDNVKKLLKDWEPLIIIQCTDAAECYSMIIKNRLVTDIIPEKKLSNYQIIVEGEINTLVRVFSGSLNPAEAVLDGELAVYGSDKDQLKLDALSLIIWGM